LARRSFATWMMNKLYEKNCRECLRLATFLDDVNERYPDYFCRPVPPFGALDARFLIVGLAPGMHGANRTGRPFTGDHAGILLYQMLHKYGFASHDHSEAADDDLTLIDCRITNAVKCHLQCISRQRITNITERLRRSGAWWHRAPGHYQSTRNAPGRFQIWSCRVARCGVFPTPRFVSLQSLQHQHPPLDHRDVRRNICAGAGVAG